MLDIITSNPKLYMEYHVCHSLFVNLWMQFIPGRRYIVSGTSKRKEIITRCGIRGIVTRSLVFAFFILVLVCLGQYRELIIF
jgi:hypothetical protein